MLEGPDYCKIVRASDIKNVNWMNGARVEPLLHLCLYMMRVTAALQDSPSYSPIFLRYSQLAIQDLMLRHKG